MDIRDIGAQLNSRVESLVAELLPDGKRQGSEWLIGSVNGETGQSTRIHLTGRKTGVWADFAGTEKGDLIDLIGAVKGLSLAEALRWAKEWLGVIEPEFHRAAPPKTYRKPSRRAGTVTPRSAVRAYLVESRGLKPETLAEFKIGEINDLEFKVEGASRQMPAIVFPSLTGPTATGELVFVKYLAVERTADGKKITKVEAGCEPILFGWQAMPPNSREVCICEGEINAMSWHQLGVSALATPYGAGKGAKHDWIDSEWERLERFEKIYLDFDQDPPGREAVKMLAERLGRHRCLVAPAKPDGYKDINDCLFFGGMTEDAASALLDQSANCDPEELRPAPAFTDAVIDLFFPPENAPKDCLMPFPSLHGRVDIRLGELTVWAGFSGHGKTQLLSQVNNHLNLNGLLTCEASFEMLGPKLLRRKVRQLIGRKEPESKEYVRQVMEWMRGRAWIFDHVGSANAKRVLEVFEYAYQRYGVQYFTVDSLTKLGIGEEDYDGQKRAVDAMSNWVMIRQAHIDLVVHCRKDRDENRPPGKFDVRGSVGITDVTHNVFLVWRNKAKEKAREAMNRGIVADWMEGKMQEADAFLICDKQREGDGELPTVELFFDQKESQQYAESQNDLGRAFVPFEMPNGASVQDEFEQDYPEF